MRRNWPLHHRHTATGCTWASAGMTRSGARVNTGGATKAAGGCGEIGAQSASEAGTGSGGSGSGSLGFDALRGIRAVYSSLLITVRSLRPLVRDERAEQHVHLSRDDLAQPGHVDAVTTPVKADVDAIGGLAREHLEVLVGQGGEVGREREREGSGRPFHEPKYAKGDKRVNS